MDSYGKQAGEILGRVRATRPVVHSVTNFVVMNSTANVLLAMGASPIMAHAPEELEDIVAIANSLVINIGTLAGHWIDSMHLACRLAIIGRKPFVLDPVGAGATRLRTETAREIVKNTPPTVIRGNASEILALSPEGGVTRGVDSMHAMEAAIEAAKGLALSAGTVAAVTGERDLVTDGRRTLVVSGGHSLMSCVTGTGCAASVIVGAFLAVEPDALIAAASALAFFGLAAERAAAGAHGPGSFWVKTLDELHAVTPEELRAAARIVAA
jgi:hydroxyethylthiazole kinase